MILFFDTETTGLPDWNADPYEEPERWPWPLEVAWSLYQRRDDEWIARFPEEPRYERVGGAAHLVKPDGWTITAAAIAVHGITEVVASAYGRSLPLVLSELVPLLTNTAVVSLTVGHNVVFDWSVIGAACLRANLPGFATALRYSPVRRCCTMQETTEFCGLPGRRGFKWPTLSELCLKLGITYEDKHRAMPDVEATAACWMALERLGFWGEAEAPG